jgi:hypothetical protein
MHSAEKHAVAKPAPHTPTPTELLRAAYDDVEQQQVLGSTTAIVVTLESMAKDKASIHVANLGDSGIMLVRPSGSDQPPTKLFRSVEQQHSFNFPFQLGGGGGDRPEMADRHNIPVVENDLVVLGTDGLFDNLFDEEIVEIIDKHVAACGGILNCNQAELSQMTEAIAKATSIRANHRTADTPFAKGARAVRSLVSYAAIFSTVQCIWDCVNNSHGCRHAGWAWKLQGWQAGRHHGADCEGAATTQPRCKIVTRFGIAACPLRFTISLSCPMADANQTLARSRTRGRVTQIVPPFDIMKQQSSCLQPSTQRSDPAYTVSVRWRQPQDIPSIQYPTKLLVAAGNRIWVDIQFESQVRAKISLHVHTFTLHLISEQSWPG